jgi:hypothetical protein
MISKIIEVTNRQFNWGKFLLLRPDTEWQRRAVMDPYRRTALLGVCGWTPEHLWVLDLQTGEGAYFKPGGVASADLDKHRIWVCPMFEPFLAWLYEQDLSDFSQLPDRLDLPHAPPELYGYRRPGSHT